MVGLLGYLAAGAAEGVGEGIVDKAKALRAERLAELDRNFTASENEKNRQFQLDNRHGDLIDLGGGKYGVRRGSKVEPLTDQDGKAVQINASPGFRVLSTDEKTKLGLPADGAFQIDREGKVSQIGGSGTDIRVDMGTIPPGYRAIRDDAGNVVQLEPVPGSPAAAEADAVTRKGELRDNQQAITSDTVVSSAQKAREAMSQATLPATGTFSSTIAEWLPETAAAEVRRQVDALKAVAASENINAMRQASPTGGALGNASDADIKLLKDKAGALDPAAGPERFRQQLDDYERTLLRIVHGKEEGDAIFERTRPVKDSSKSQAKNRTPSGVEWSID